MVPRRLSGPGDTFAGYRARLVETLRAQGIRDLAVLKAFAETPRHLFVPEAVRHRAYEDAALPIGKGQTISQPFTQARYLEALGLRGGERVLEIGTGSGYQTALIAGLGESLVDGVNQSREDYEATGRIIVRETLRLRRLVKDLHMMTRVEANAVQPQRQPVRLAALVDEVLAMLITEFERANVEPCNIIAYTLPPVLADPDMLSRVFSNLCNNALRHTPLGTARFVPLLGDHGFDA